jgi:RNA polymerase sigma-70 factor (ECF subfamily)
MSEVSAAALESRVLAAIDSGDLAAAATLVVRDYGPGILGFLASILRDDQRTRDVFSEFSEELWKALPRYARRSTVKTWAYAIAYRCLLRQRRTLARRRTRPLRDSEYSRLAASIRSTTPSFSKSAADRKLDALRATLRPAEQTLLILRIDRRMSWDQIADVLAVKSEAGPAVVRKRFERLKQRLRAHAERDGLL